MLLCGTCSQIQQVRFMCNLFYLVVLVTANPLYVLTCGTCSQIQPIRFMCNLCYLVVRVTANPLYVLTCGTCYSQSALCVTLWYVFSNTTNPFLAPLSQRLKWAIVIAHRPSSVRPSVRRPSVNFHIFDFSSETAERNSTKLDRKQDLNALYQVCVFRADRKTNMAALASDWLRHFRLLLWNRWTEFNETWQEARSQRLLPSLCFSGRLENQDGRPGPWLAETFSTSPLKPLNRK